MILAATLACFPETTFNRNTGLDNSVEVDMLEEENSTLQKNKLDDQTTSSQRHNVKSFEVEKDSQTCSWKYHFGFGAVKFHNQSHVFKLRVSAIEEDAIQD